MRDLRRNQTRILKDGRKAKELKSEMEGMTKEHAWPTACGNWD